ncbi:hypothetical protein OE88DRAFT_1734013 [Heliocybe sulcata]|uniref:Uncharacterized protein n=1 Tax=Heliocybe sulcata TaxID=5364 RepID=A0A5C3N5V4_9AGAM|nr:hypothetical protein OE88DRAFT_1734013 [Heliocybe sulcata]
MVRWSSHTCCVVALCCLLLVIDTSIAALINVTIDDTNGDARTGRKPDWVGGWEFPNTDCQKPDGNPILATTCSQGVDPSLAYDGTWTGMTINATTAVLGGTTTLNLTFYGTAIYVYHIIPAAASFCASVFAISYSVDGEAYALMSYSKTSTTQYNQLAYVRQELALTQHVLGLLIGDPETGLPQMFFDYAVYTTDDGMDSSSSASTLVPSHTSISPGPTSVAAEHSQTQWSETDTGAIVGGSVALLVAIGVIAGVFLYRRRRRNGAHAEGESFIPSITFERSTAHLGPPQEQQGRTTSEQQSSAFLSPNLNPTSSESFYSESEEGSCQAHTPLFSDRPEQQSSVTSTPRSNERRQSRPPDYRNSGSFISPPRGRTVQRRSQSRPPAYNESFLEES